MAQVKPINREAVFELHELFFSRTNKRGIIQSGNDVFVRVSGYPIEKILNAPHSIIRHPDMPRCVFQLFWKMIQADRPICAYVKNIAQDGSYYWVLAVAFPIADGYLSLRLKPSSPLLSKVKEIYEETLKHENVHGMESAQEVLFQALKSIGFETYEKFMTHALVEEMRSRDQKLKESKDHSQKGSTPFFSESLDSIRYSQRDLGLVFETLIKLITKGTELKGVADSALSRFSDLTFLSMNMAIGAAKVGSEGRTLAEVSNGFKEMANQIQSQVESFNEKLERACRGISESQFQIGCSRLQIEMVQAFLAETNAIGVGENAKKELKEFFTNYSFLLTLSEATSEGVRNELVVLTKTLSELVSASVDLLSILNGLEVIRLTGKVEAARLPEIHRNSFENQIEQMTDFVENLSSGLRKVRNVGKSCLEDMEKSVTNLNSTVRIVEKMIQIGKQEAIKLVST